MALTSTTSSTAAYEAGPTGYALQSAADDAWRAW